MEQPTTIDVDADACPCCGVAITGQFAHEAGACERCADYPYGERDCGGLHADALRMAMVVAVRERRVTPGAAIAAIAADDAHRAGQLRQVRVCRDGCPWRGAGCEVAEHKVRWVYLIDVPSPDPTAWERMSRLEEADRTIREVTNVFAARPYWNGAEFRRALVSRLNWNTRQRGFHGIWHVEVLGPGQVDIRPPAGYVEPDTAETRKRDTVDQLVREAILS